MVKKWALWLVTAMNLIAVPTLAAEQGRIFKDRSGTVFQSASFSPPLAAAMSNQMNRPPARILRGELNR
jgi:hypothetical protein